MARLPRLYAPAIVQHIVQRPSDGRVLFVDADDYRLFIALLAEAVVTHGLALHAYVLLPTQFRLLATPRDPGAIARAMQSIGRRYVVHLNRRTGRSGPLWDRRYRSTLIDADRWLIPSMRFIERLPATAGTVATPGQWPWSSHGHHVGREQQAFLNDHAAYWALSNTPFERQALYGALVEAPVDEALAERIEQAVERGWVLGDAAFVAAVAGVLNRRGAPLARGRRPKPQKTVPISREGVSDAL
jgi:putative transposase